MIKSSHGDIFLGSIVKNSHHVTDSAYPAEHGRPLFKWGRSSGSFSGTYNVPSHYTDFGIILCQTPPIITLCCKFTIGQYMRRRQFSQHVQASTKKSNINTTYIYFSSLACLACRQHFLLVCKELFRVTR